MASKHQRIKRTCIVHIDKEFVDTGLQEETHITCSGVVLDPANGYILTSGAIFSNIKQPTDLKDCRSFSVEQVLDQPSISKVHVILEKLDKSFDPENEKLSIRAPADSTVISKPFTVCEGVVKGVWMVPSFQQVLRKLFEQGEGWSFSEGLRTEDADSISSSLEVTQVKGRSLENDLKWLAAFSLIQVNEKLLCEEESVAFVPADHLYIGAPVTLEGTPFGSIHPSVFSNSLSSGIITNMAGEDRSAILTDARCMAGTEGGAVWLKDSRRNLAGLIVAPMCWKINQWVGLSLACTISSIIHSMPANLKEQCLTGTQPYLALSYGDSLECINFLDSIVLIRVGRTWGSGVVINTRQGLILTCRHVVEGSDFRQLWVRLGSMDQSKWVKGHELFCTRDSSAVDLAIVKLDEIPSSRKLQELPISTSIREGEPVFALGFPLFGPETQLGPSVTSGCVSKLLMVDNKPSILQTTCAIHAGSSGGAIISQRSGKLVGIIANNCRDEKNNITIPHLNFCVPSSIFYPPILSYLQTKDLNSFEVLNNQDSTVDALWRLKTDDSALLPKKSKL